MLGYLMFQVMQEYQQHIGDIQKMRETMEAKKKRLERLQTQLNENKKKWLEPLHKLIDNINTNFSNYFRAMGCVGEVALGAPENEVSSTCPTPYVNCV